MTSEKYHGARSIVYSTLDWNRWIICKLEVDAVPHNWIQCPPRLQDNFALNKFILFGDVGFSSKVFDSYYDIAFTHIWVHPVILLAIWILKYSTWFHWVSRILLHTKLIRYLSLSLIPMGIQTHTGRLKLNSSMIQTQTKKQISCYSVIQGKANNHTVLHDSSFRMSFTGLTIISPLSLIP